MSGEVLSTVVGTGLKLIKQPVELTYNVNVVSGTRGVPENNRNWPWQVFNNPQCVTSEVIGVPIGTRVKVYTNKPFTILNATTYGQPSVATEWITSGYHEIIATYQLITLAFRNEDNSEINPSDVECKVVISKGV